MQFVAQPNQSFQNWVFNMKKALAYRIYPDPNVTCDITEILHNELSEEFHNRISLFSFNDIEKTFTVELLDNIYIDYSNGIYAAIEKMLWRFFCAYKTSIENAIYEFGGNSDKNLFNDIMESRQTKSLLQIVTVSYYPINKDNKIGTSFSIRLY